MYNYRRRNVQALSGGQQQRVAIARAIAKNPKVVLADEPTGNLDANNTYEIMSIIKKISQERLVILVSHERSLVDFYADRVITLTDGVVNNDYDNSGNRSLEHKDERIIYLKDLHKDDSLEGSGIERYYDSSKDEGLSFQIIEVKDSVYIRAKSRKKIKYLTDETEIKLVNEHYKAKQSEDELEFNFDLDQFGVIKQSQNKRSYIKLPKTIKNGFIKVISPRKVFGKMLLLAYFVISALVAYQLGTLGSYVMGDEFDYIHISNDIIGVRDEEYMDQSDIDYLLDNVEGIEWSPYFTQVSVGFKMYDFYQGEVNVGTYAYPMKESWVDSADLIEGRMPENSLEVVVDKWILDYLLTSKELKDLEITDISSFLGLKMYSGSGYALLDYDYYYTPEPMMFFDIVGIIDTDSPTIVVADESILAFIDVYSGLLAYSAAEGRIEIESGRGIEAENEIMIGAYLDDELSVGDTYSVYGITYDIVGIFTVNEEYYDESLNSIVIVSDSIIEATQKENVRYYASTSSSYNSGSGLYFYTDDINKAIEDINTLALGYEGYDAYATQQTYYQETLYAQNSGKIRAVLIITIGIVVYIFLTMRTSMLNRIREIGIYRAIGATKRDIYKIFFGEIIATTTMGSLTGYVAMSILILRIQSMAGEAMNLFNMPLSYFIGGIVFIYTLNIVFGMLPVFNLLRKTPSEISAKYDI